MAKFQCCDPSVAKMAGEILDKHETHHPVRDAKVKIDFVFAYADEDETTGEPIGHAIMHDGNVVLGECRKVSLKNRAKGMGDAEITLDGDWWKGADDREREALLDHELHHVAIKIDKRGLVTDDLGRPVLQMRKHDVTVGWFKIIAERHGQFSQECKQAADIMDAFGQLFWPAISGAQGEVVKETSGRMRNLEIAR